MSNPVLSDPTAPPAAPTGPLADLILVRLLPARESVGAPVIVKDVRSLYRRPPTGEQVAETVEGLKAAGLIAPGKGQRLTAAGRARALEYLGVAELPPRANWGTVKARYLVPKALGFSPGSDEAKAMTDSRTFVPRLLKREFGLPPATRNTIRAAVRALACQKLGFPDEPTLEGVLARVYATVVNASEPIREKEALTVLPRVLLRTQRGGTDAARTAVLTRLTEPRADGTTPGEPFDLEAFANTVRSAARTCPTGRFGDNKVFISHVWRQLKDEPRFAPLGLRGFKDKLLEANRENLLTLSRADLVQLMDPADVRESEASFLNAVFHFILVEKE